MSNTDKTVCVLVVRVDVPGAIEPQLEVEVHRSEEECYKSLLLTFENLGRDGGAPDHAMVEASDMLEPGWTRRYLAALESGDWRRAFLLWSTDKEADGSVDSQWPGLCFMTWSIHRQTIGSTWRAVLVADDSGPRLPRNEHVCVVA